MLRWRATEAVTASLQTDRHRSTLGRPTVPLSHRVLPCISTFHNPPSPSCSGSTRYTSSVAPGARFAICASLLNCYAHFPCSRRRDPCIREPSFGLCRWQQFCSWPGLPSHRGRPAAPGSSGTTTRWVTTGLIESPGCLSSLCI